jgi:acylphosphatase
MFEKVTKRIHIIFKGRVQGVGFRYATVEAAEVLKITGWVKNLSNGDVEVVAEQRQDILEDFIERLEREFCGYIKNKEVGWEPATGVFKGFSVSF